ncbi:MAG: hypothetical protein K2L10_05240 [Ruminococcus sp.]|nr:hypothetical protein [Ruminococcus sp.]
MNIALFSVEKNGHLSGAIIYYIIFAHILIVMYFLWIAFSTVKLISAMEEFRQTDKSDVDKLKACKKKIIFRSSMTVIPLVLFASLVIVP